MLADSGRNGVMTMLSVRRRSVLLRLGASALKSTVSASGLSDAGLQSDAHEAFDQLADDADWPGQFANQIYLVEMVLPVTAFYRALRQRGWAQSDAVRTVHQAFLATGSAQRRLFALLLRTRLGARLYLRSLRPNWLGLTPPPANQWTVARRGSDTLIEVSRCYRLDAFRQLGAPEVAFVACYFEGMVMDVSPFIDLTFTSMATGAERCRIDFELLDKTTKQPVEPDRYLRPPAA